MTIFLYQIYLSSNIIQLPMRVISKSNNKFSYCNKLVMCCHCGNTNGYLRYTSRTMQCYFSITRFCYCAINIVKPPFVSYCLYLLFGRFLIIGKCKKNPNGIYKFQVPQLVDMTAHELIACTSHNEERLSKHTSLRCSIFQVVTGNTSNISTYLFL